MRAAAAALAAVAAAAAGPPPVGMLQRMDDELLQACRGVWGATSGARCQRSGSAPEPRALPPRRTGPFLALRIGIVVCFLLHVGVERLQD